MSARAAEILEAFPRYSALIVGDVCLGRWCTFDRATSEPSRETGIPRIGIVSTEVARGAGGNVAGNLAALGIGRAAVPGGVLGNDGFAHELTRALNSRGIATDLLVSSDHLPTFTYTKLVNLSTGVEDLPRLDFISAQPLGESVEQEVLGYLRDFASSFDIIFVSDQADTRRGGVVMASVRALLEEITAASPEKIVWVDSRIRVERFQRMILKPNEREANAASIALFGVVDYQLLRTHTNCKLMFVTKGPGGVVVVEDGANAGAGLLGGTPFRSRRSGRQLFSRRCAGFGNHRFGNRGGPLRKPGGIHHHPQARHSRREFGGGVGRGP